jgi:hypothetical protein
MKSIVDFINESLENSIYEAASNDVKLMKKWLKEHKAKKLKVVGDEISIIGKTGSTYNELTFDNAENELPEYVKFNKEPYNATLEITGKGLLSLKGFPAPSTEGSLNIWDSDLEDFDLDFSNNKENGTITLHNCNKLKSFSGFKTIKGNSIPYVYIYGCKSLSSLQDFEGKNIKLSRVENADIKSLKGYPVVRTDKGGSDIKVFNCPNLVSLDIESNLTPNTIEIQNCPKLSKVGNINFKNGEVNYLYICDCPNVDEAFIEELVDNIKFGKDWGIINLAGTKVSENSNIVKKLKKKCPDFDFKF